MKTSGETLLMVADSERDANMLYAVRMFVADPFIYLRHRGKPHLVLSDLEIDRARRTVSHCRILSHSDCVRRLRQQGIEQPSTAHVIQSLLRAKKIRSAYVPANFPLGLARSLDALNIRVRLKPGSFFPERSCKSAEEVKKISAALMMAEVGLAEGMHALKHSKVGRNRRLTYHGAPLTSEKLRGIIDTAVLQAGGRADHTIVAGGGQGCDPHEGGHGVLRANEPIIIDVFPRSQRTGYYGDITRTVVKGRASEAFKKLYHTVARAQEIAFEHLRHDSPARQVQQQVDEFFAREGYKTGKSNGRMEGFFHGVGHGLGLEIHEAPRIGRNSPDTLQAGQVVTVEPGLYYSRMGGGVRLEDVALITGNGPRNLTQFEKVLEI